MFSLILTRVSPSGKELTTASPRGAPIDWQILRARSRCADPENIFISRLNGVIARRKGAQTLMLKSAFARIHRGPMPPQETGDRSQGPRSSNDLDPPQTSNSAS